MSDSRRKELIKKLTETSHPVKGSELAELFGVSRQAIVQDIAVLRARGNNILATSNGYMISREAENPRLGVIKTIVSRHSGLDDLETELKIIVEYGGKIRDVIVEHPVYGELIGVLQIETLNDVQQFLENVKNSNAKPLASLTGGEHIHTLEVPSEKIYNLICQELSEHGFLID